MAWSDVDDRMGGDFFKLADGEVREIVFVREPDVSEIRTMRGDKTVAHFPVAVLPMEDDDNPRVEILTTDSRRRINQIRKIWPSLVGRVCTVTRTGEGFETVWTFECTKRKPPKPVLDAIAKWEESNPEDGGDGVTE